MKKESGFTLIELLVVIAIIGILASVVLASLNSARQKSRDARRISDIKQLQTALTLYSSDNSDSYPSTTATLSPTYIPVVPTDPQATTTQYFYAGLGAVVDDPICISYHLGATLETSNTALDNDADDDSTSLNKCDGGGAGFDASNDATDRRYDVRP